MNDQWKNLYIKEINQALCVFPNRGDRVHKNRPHHGLVFIFADSNKEYHFSDGRVIRAHKNSLFYLPKGSSYYADSDLRGGCLVINFEADVSDAPFVVNLRSSDEILHRFKKAVEAWRKNDDARELIALRAVYEAIYQANKEMQKQYIPSGKIALIAPAIEAINQRFSENDLSVSYLADLCNISEVYLRNLFSVAFGVSPKKYILQKRMEYAKVLLKSGDFSVSEVSALCGYVAPSHFSKDFSKHVGISPSRFWEVDI